MAGLVQLTSAGAVSWGPTSFGSHGEGSDVAAGRMVFQKAGAVSGS